MAVKVSKKRASTKSKSTQNAGKDTASDGKQSNADKTTAKNKSAQGAPKTGQTKSTKREAKSAIFQDRLAFAAGMILAQKYTDEQIIDATNDKFADYAGKKYDQKEMGRTRWMLRHDMVKAVKVDGKPFDRVFLGEDGKVYTRENRPKKARKSSKKYDANNDPLGKMGVNVHDDEATAKKKTAKKKVAKKKAAASA